MSQRPKLIFDAGGVLVFPNFELLSEIGEQVGIATSPQEMAAQHSRLFHAFDKHVARHRQFPDIQYFQNLFEQVTESKPKAQAALKLTLEADREEHIWATTRPWVNETLQQLREQDYQLAVISNSDGRVDQILQDLDLHEYFETVVDSHVVGVEKPDSRIFEIALNRLGWKPAETIYVGDIFYIDVWGANQAGLGAIHLDKMGLYDDWEGIHIPSLYELLSLLAEVDGNLQNWDLYPARDFEINF